jgi:hypothetical protein
MPSPKQNDAHPRCGLPPPIDATQHQTNSAIALQKCRNNSECSGLKGWLGANKHEGFTMARDEHNKAAEHPNITKTQAKAHRSAAEHHGKGDHAKGKEHAASAKQHSQTANQHSDQAHSKSQQQK